MPYVPLLFQNLPSTTTPISAENLNNMQDAIKTAYDTAEQLNAAKGTPGGIATLNQSGLIEASQLPSYVDDVLEYASLGGFPVAGESSKIYVAVDTNRIYRWSGSTYIEISSAALADAAIKLNTARLIGGVSFDGTQNIDLPGVNTAGNQNTTGNAATATKLATARTIQGVSFDGSANITLPDASTTQKGVTQLINDLTTGGIDKSLTAEQGKLLFAMFTGSDTHFCIPDPTDPTKPWIVQFSSVSSANNANTVATFPVTFPNSCHRVLPIGQTTSGAVIAVVTLNFFSTTSATFNVFTANAGNPLYLAGAGAVTVSYIAIGK